MNQISSLLRTFKYAFIGIGIGSRQRSFRIQMVLGMIVISMGAILQINITEWAILFLCGGAVLSAEVMNTAIEELCNVLRKNNVIHYDHLGLPKDLAAGAVLLMSMASVIVGLVIFLPKFKIF